MNVKLNIDLWTPENNVDDTWDRYLVADVNGRIYCFFQETLGM